MAVELGTNFHDTFGDLIAIHEDTAKDNYLRCPNNPPRPRTEATLAFELFDSYGNISFDDEKKRLDGLALELRKDSKMRACIIAYAGRRMRAGELQKRVTRAKNYLVNELEIKADRIMTKDGGCREDLTIGLYLMPPVATEPTPNPTVIPCVTGFTKDNAGKNKSHSSESGN